MSQGVRRAISRQVFEVFKVRNARGQQEGCEGAEENEVKRIERGNFVPLPLSRLRFCHHTLAFCYQVGVSDDAYAADGSAMTPEEAIERKTRTVKLQFNLPTGERLSEDIVSIAQLCKDVDAMVRGSC
jgi:hypothetical protein